MGAIPPEWHNEGRHSLKTSLTWMLKREFTFEYIEKLKVLSGLQLLFHLIYCEANYLIYCEAGNFDIDRIVERVIGRPWHRKGGVWYGDGECRSFIRCVSDDPVSGNCVWCETEHERKQT